MAKKRGKDKEQEPALPKFGGFKPLAGGLAEMKAKLDAEEAERKKKNEPPKPPPRPQPAPAKKQAATSSADDELSFHRMMMGVVPLAGSGSARVPVTSEPRGPTTRSKADDLRAKAQAETAQVHAHLASLVDDVVRFEVTDDGRHVEGRRVDVPPSLLRTLRRGQLPIDGRLDLHGLAAEVAREKVAEFLKDKRAKGERCVLVIHGKGNHSPGGGGVLRGEIAAWLSQTRAREHVAAFATAREEDGGEGAVYIALRR